MAKKLFALEDFDSDSDVAELEASPEVGEAADVEASVAPDVVEIQEQSEAIDDGMQAADQLEEVEEVVEAAADDEGINEQAAECLRIAVEAICARVGANPKAMYSLYATENFRSASSRKANTRIALEGVGEFLKDLWKKIKEALLKLWEKAKAFFDKHISALGRIKKALESMKTKISESSGKLKDRAYFDEAPSSLVEAFPGTEDIGHAVIMKYIRAHREITPNTDAFANGLQVINEKIEKVTKKENVRSVINDIKQMKNDETKLENLVGGLTITYKFEADDEGNVTVDVDRDTIEDKNKNLGISIDDKAGLNELIKETTAIINDTIKYKEKQDKYKATFNKLMLSLEKFINNIDNVELGKINAQKTEEDDTNYTVKSIRVLIKIAYKVNSKLATINTEIFNLNVKLAKAVVKYISFCLKQYKMV